MHCEQLSVMSLNALCCPFVWKRLSFWLCVSQRRDVLAVLKDEFKCLSDVTSSAEHRECYSREGVDQHGVIGGTSSSSSLTPPDLRACRSEQPLNGSQLPEWIQAAAHLLRTYKAAGWSDRSWKELRNENSNLSRVPGEPELMYVKVESRKWADLWVKASHCVWLKGSCSHDTGFYHRLNAVHVSHRAHAVSIFPFNLGCMSLNHHHKYVARRVSSFQVRFVPEQHQK